MKMEPQVTNCSHRAQSCPRQWATLKETESAIERFCESCSQTVYLCEDEGSAITHAIAGHCVAMSLVSEPELPAMWLGTPPKVPVITDAQREALKQHHLDSEKVRALKDAKYSNRLCEYCGFPIATWRKTCWVCDAAERRRPT